MSLLIRSLNYVGGKAGIVDWILENLPGGNIYVEAFGGAAWVLLNKPRHQVEVYNDLNKTMVTFFRVVQDEEKFEKLFRKLEFTLFSREEFGRAIEILDAPDQYSDIDVAWARYVLQEQGFSGNTIATIGGWGRRMKDNGNYDAYSKLKYLPMIRDRLNGVQIDSRDALEVIRYWDSPQTVFYLDPPYVASTRKCDVYGDYEQDEQFHVQLIDLLSEISDAFALSSYQNPIYDRLVERGVAKMLTHRRNASSIGKTRMLQNKKIIGTDEWEQMQTRTECLYIKSNGIAKQPSLFTEFLNGDDGSVD